MRRKFGEMNKYPYLCTIKTKILKTKATMKIKEFKHEFSFNEWEKTHNPDKLYCIHTPDMTQELFDVYEDDFIEMVDQGIVNGDGCYYLLGKPTEEDIKDYAKKYGIKWI